MPSGALRKFQKLLHVKLGACEKNMNDFFIAVYTAYPKRYCDEIFFKRLGEIAGDEYVSIIDNSQNSEYTKRLEVICDRNLKKYSLNHLYIEPGERLFLRAVGNSVSLLQNQFLRSDKKYFLILESDVFPKDDNILDLFRNISTEADIIGGIYYAGPHDPAWFADSHSEIVTSLVLSGCTLYNRHVLENIQFRIDLNNPNAFPDAYMCKDARERGYKCVNFTGIKCDHLHSPEGGRGHGEIC